MICMRLCVLDTIHHAAYNKLETKMPKHIIAHSEVRSEVLTKGISPKATRTMTSNNFSKLGTEPISLPASGLV